MRRRKPREGGPSWTRSSWLSSPDCRRGDLPPRILRGNPAQGRAARIILSCGRLSAVSATGELSLAVQEHSCKGPDAIRFPEQLLDQAPGKLPAIRDGAPIRRRAVRNIRPGERPGVSNRNS